MATSPEWMLTEAMAVRCDLAVRTRSSRIRCSSNCCAPRNGCSPCEARSTRPRLPIAGARRHIQRDAHDSTATVVKPTVPTEPNSTREHTAYEVTRIKLSLASVTDHVKREAIWGLLREVASAADPARRA